MRSMNYQESVDFIFGHTNYEAVPRLSHAEANYDLRRVFQLLERLGNPHLKAKSLHITGTNGKGSTSAMLASVLTAAGYRTGLYTSPHLITMRERFNVDGRMITEEIVAGLATRLKPEIEAVDTLAAYGRLTVFEILTALCFVWFAEQKCDFQVMEVGMGGRFDATNVIQPEVCLLTSISLDHTGILGDTIAKIATEKCGIIKPGCVVVSHPQTLEAEQVIMETCLKKGVDLIKIGSEVTCRGLRFDLHNQSMEIKGRLADYVVTVPLLGQHQMDNTAAVVAALEVLIERGFQISKGAILKGLSVVDFPGRMQIAGQNPLIVLDGGHNLAAARKLREALQGYFMPARSILVIGMSVDKDMAGVVSELTPVFDQVITTRAENPRSASPESLAVLFVRQGKSVTSTGNVPQALDQARRAAGENDLICVTGSLFVVGEALKNLTKNPSAQGGSG
jgi:dihydrofolate synthase / folylpolyglutamate synthase